MKYSDLIADWLVDLGYTHCFTVGGGNIMHLTESLSRKMKMVAVVNEVAAGIAAEYFNETSKNGKAFALVTAGPGLTNIVTAMAGAYLESRELLVIGGQAKTLDLARGLLRQRGIQEIDGVSIAKPITVCSRLMDDVLSADEFADLVMIGRSGRKGPVFLEIPLDIQARQVEQAGVSRRFIESDSSSISKVPYVVTEQLAVKFNEASRPVILLGGGVSREVARELRSDLAALGCPVMTTWNAADRMAADELNYLGRPNTWGQRSSNMILQQADFALIIGSRLGLQQTGFNWQQFVPKGFVVQIDLDRAELEKGHPKVDMPILGDANQFLVDFLNQKLSPKLDWLNYAKKIRKAIPLSEAINKPRDEYISPFDLVKSLSRLCNAEDVIVPCSSGSAFTSMMQVFEQKSGQTIITNKGLASMGYGLSGAIGAAFSSPNKRVVLVEGDGGFSQNLQEIGTVAINALNIKMFILDDSGYASIRMTQKNYFGGRYVGCDRETGLGLPIWDKLFQAWGVQVMRLEPGYESTPEFLAALSSGDPYAFIVSIDPEQTYFPKISSRVTASGAMESNPLHLMTPDLTPEETTLYLKYLV
ncbi:thiamine pyrophosphate-binding protein [Polynucleobacter sp. AP-Kolm-20A-A1]|uniref:thiamine pyrophosphate-binding protein n=1 Tax=Polynucleobacter sp. AP-Kolm-20A-A1 TaxID=2081041 RepID=UPI001BFDDE92|nr:thiamine pyrophosphate-binding protein [Polynucleobacter sp. AP-Kolm-20A-A1]QWE20924.1 thiamine pyrophosphate-binding protein [Polynucleobacter sp. AP-Kolm-20A-A1]